LDARLSGRDTSDARGVYAARPVADVALTGVFERGGGARCCSDGTRLLIPEDVEAALGGRASPATDLRPLTLAVENWGERDSLVEYLSGSLERMASWRALLIASVSAPDLGAAMVFEPVELRGLPGVGMPERVPGAGMPDRRGAFLPGVVIAADRVSTGQGRVQQLTCVFPVGLAGVGRDQGWIHVLSSCLVSLI
jgi:hypothetical protein